MGFFVFFTLSFDKFNYYKSNLPKVWFYFFFCKKLQFKYYMQKKKKRNMEVVKSCRYVNKIKY